MIFERAKQVGDDGERQVADALERIAPRYDVQVLNNVLLKVGQETAQIDHIAVDRFGVLLVESKVRRGALIRGRDVEHRWTACYPKGKPKVFQNPLQQNDQHAAVLRRILQAAGRPLDPDYVRSAIVFVGANISQLDLDSLNRMRVMEVADLPAYIQGRHDFAPNPGVLDARAVAALADMIRELDQSGDAEVERAHADRARGRKRKRAVDDDEPVVWKEAGFASRVEELSDAGVRHTSLARWPGLLKNALALLVVLALGGALGWYLYSGGWATIRGLLPVSMGLSSAPAPGTAQPAPPPTASVAEARAALAEAAPPEIVTGLVDPDRPAITSVPQGTTFTWEYVQAGGDAVAVKTIALTLDANRQIVGVDIR